MPRDSGLRCASPRSTGSSLSVSILGGTVVRQTLRGIKQGSPVNAIEDLQAFLGTANYHMGPAHARIMEPLMSQLKPGAAFPPSEEKRVAVEAVEELLVEGSFLGRSWGRSSRRCFMMNRASLARRPATLRPPKEEGLPPVDPSPGAQYTHDRQEGCGAPAHIDDTMRDSRAPSWCAPTLCIPRAAPES